MSLERDDIDAAVAAGVIPQAQADALLAFAVERRRTPLQQSGQEDESFRFMTGFNDFFFAIGILLLGFGIAFFVLNPQLPVGTSLAAAAFMWGLSELLVRRLRLVLPGILLSVFFLLFVFMSIPADLIDPSLPALPPLALVNSIAHVVLGFTGAPLVTAIKSLIAAVIAGLYYWRFRVPFTLLLIASSLVVAAGPLVELGVGRLPQMAGSLFGLACGLVVFAVAMRYDMSDRERVTRRSDCAVWLHLLAAPLIVHSLISLLTTNIARLDSTAAVAIILIVAILAVVAIVIDRRALLVSALLYVGVVIAYTIGGPLAGSTRSIADQSLIFFATLVLLGLFVIVLGVGWVPLRRWLVCLISASIAARLPPVPNRA